MTTREKGIKVVEKRAELEKQYPQGYCTLISEESEKHNTRGGVVVEVSVYNAARHLVDKTHRFATEAEVSEFRANQASEARSIRMAEDAKRAVFYRRFEDEYGQPAAPAPIQPPVKGK